MRIFFLTLFSLVSGIAYCQQNLVNTASAIKIHAYTFSHNYRTADTPKTTITGITKPFAARSFIIPATLITYGFVAVNNHNLRQLDLSTRDNIVAHNPGFKTSIDDYSQYVPALAVYGLNAAGIKGKNNFLDRTLSYLMATGGATAAVLSLKKINGITRPDGSANNSFPSGHTATAFAAAEFLHQEYKDQSAWYSVGGYAIATATGIMRMYNDRHFLSDVVCGAGIGMISTKLAYLIYPLIKKKFCKRAPATTVI